MSSRKPAPRSNGSTGPRTPEGKLRCRMNAYRHGLTSKLRVYTPDEEPAYQKHRKVIFDFLAPVGDVELEIAQTIADDQWRLKRAFVIENSNFAVDQHPDAADAGFDSARTWRREARNLQLLTVYEQRIRRAVEKNMAKLEDPNRAVARNPRNGGSNPAK